MNAAHALAAPTAAPPRTAAQEEDRLPLGEKLAYGAGGLGTAVAGSMFLFFFSFYLTDVVRLTPLLVAVIQLVRNGWDAVNDPLIGALTDRTRTRWGRRKPFILLGLIPFGLLFALLWHVPPTRAPWATASWVIVLILLYDCAASMLSVPYSALTPELTRSYDERTSLNGFRQAFSMLGGLLVGGTGEYLIAHTGWAKTGWLFGALSALPFIAVLLFVKERHSVAAPPRKEPGPLQLFRRTLKNRAFVVALAVYLLSWTAVSVTSTMFIYFLTHTLKMGGQVFIALLAVQLAALGSIPAIVWLSNRCGKRSAYVIGITFWAVVQLGLFFLPAGPSPLVYVLAACAGIGVGAAHVLPWAMVPDCIDLDELQTGERREGAYYGVMGLLEKLGTGLALGGVGLVLQLYGYEGGVPQQSEAAAFAMRLLMGPVPALLLVLSLVAVCFYPLSRAKHASIRAAMARRQV